MPTRLFLVLALLALTAPRAAATEFEVRSGFELLARDQSHATGFHVLSFTTELGGGFRFGKSLFSAASGDAGGSFLAGFEVAKRVRLGGGLSFEVGGTIGGGGGVWVVDGDGLLTRVYLVATQELAHGWSASIGASHIAVEGTDISSPAVAFSVTQQFGLAVSPGTNASPFPGTDAFQIAAVKPYLQRHVAVGSERRGGGTQDDFSTFGAEFVFARPSAPDRQYFVEAAGAVLGDSGGFAHWQLGQRWQADLDPVRVFAKLGAGFGGGGGVDTGPGFMVSATAGAALPLTHGLSVEAGVAAMHAPWGDFTSVAPFVAASIRSTSPGRPTTRRGHAARASGRSGSG